MARKYVICPRKLSGRPKYRVMFAKCWEILKHREQGHACESSQGEKLSVTLPYAHIKLSEALLFSCFGVCELRLNAETCLH